MKTFINMRSFQSISILIVSLSSLLSIECKAQEPNFSMYHYAPFFTNPASIGTVEDVRLMLNYRNQSIEAGDNFRSSSLSAYYPVYIGNHRLVIAGNFLNDQASDFVSTNGGLLGVAYSIRLSESSSLSVGMQGGYFQRKTDSDFITDDQFVNGVLDPNVVSGDAVLNQTKSYPTLSGGVHFQTMDNEGREKGFMGVSLFNATEPNISFIDDNDDNLPLSFKATAGYRVYQGMKFSVLPTLRYIDQAGNNFFNLGSRFGYELDRTEEGQKKIELGFWYNTNDLGVFSIAFEQPNLIIGASYDLPIGDNLSAGQNGIFELAVSFRLKKKARKTPIAQSTSTTQGPRDADNKSPEEDVKEGGEDEITDSSQDTETKEKSVITEVIEDSDTEEEVVIDIDPTVTDRYEGLTDAERAILAQTVRFDFNAETLDQESRVFLDEVADILKRRDALKVELIGHSCDIGPETVNDELSKQRAESVQQYLVQKGISQGRFVIKGLGENQPKKSNATEQGRQHNRRVEFKVIE